MADDNGLRHIAVIFGVTFYNRNQIIRLHQIDNQVLKDDNFQLGQTIMML